MLRNEHFLPVDVCHPPDVVAYLLGVFWHPHVSELAPNTELNEENRLL